MTVRFMGRVVDPISLWSEFVDFPPNMDETQEFSQLVQCPNPDHMTTKRHFQINLKSPLVHCFANCGISGTYEHAIAMIEGGTQRAARKTILRHSRISGGTRPTRKKRPGTRPVDPIPNLAYERYLPPAALDYLRGRGFTDSTISKWELGWDSEDLRIVIPAKDHRGRLKFLIRRTIKQNVEPRYLYPASPIIHKLLFGACYIDPRLIRSEGIILVEGSLDTMMMHQHGFGTTVGILGSKLSEIQAQLISSMRPAKIITMFDADGAGIGATISTIKRLHKVPVFVARYPRGKTDPAALTQEEAARVIKRVISYRKFRHLAGIESPKTKKEISYSGKR